SGDGHRPARSGICQCERRSTKEQLLGGIEWFSETAHWTTFEAHDDRTKSPARHSKVKETDMNHEITLEVAEKMIGAAKSKAEELKILEDIAVVDASGNLKAFVRMDGAWLGSIDIAIRKARTARYFD